MKLFKLFALLVIAVPTIALAQTDIDTGLPLGNGKWLTSRTATNQAQNKILRSDTSENTEVNAPSGKSLNISIAQTPVAAADSRGLVYQSGKHPVFPAASVITPAVTYGAGLGAISAKLSVVATAGPTSQFLELPAPTANIGKTFEVVNYSANPLPLVPAAGVVNVSAALTPFACATQKKCDCTVLTSSGYWCVAQ